jgi:hypothetical protein
MEYELIAKFPDDEYELCAVPFVYKYAFVPSNNDTLTTGVAYEKEPPMYPPFL